MNADEFAEGLTRCAPSLNDLRRGGFSENFCQKLRDSFIPRWKGDTEPADQNPLVDFVLRYDASKIEIGGVRFGELKKDDNGCMCFGKEEADPLLIDAQTGEIFLEELGSDGHILCWCAADGESFLDAMLRAACFLEKCLVNSKLGQNQITSRQVAEECVNLAGGEKYSTFYYALLGAL